MVTYKGGTDLQHPLPWWRWILTGLNLLALVFSIILSWHFLKGGSIAGCSGGSPCEEVLDSQWSMIAGVLPVSGLAVGAYLATLVAGFFIGPATEAPIRQLAWSAMLILAGSVFGSAVWFTIVQSWIIGKFCLYCMTAHITGLLFAVFIIWRAIKEFDDHSEAVSQTNHIIVKNVLPVPRRNRILLTMSRSLIGLVLAVILAAFQIAFTPPPVLNDSESYYNPPAIDYHDVPMVGSPEAPYIVALLFDYNCPHCQQIHLMLNEVIHRFNGKLAFALYPTPLNTQCNPYIPRDVDEFKNSCDLVRIALAVWLANREMFPVFESWMFSFESGDKWRPRSLESTRAKAIELVGKEKFDAAINNPWIGQYMQTCIRTYGQTMQGGNGGVPKLIYGSHWVIPEPNNADELVIILQKSLGLRKP